MDGRINSGSHFPMPESPPHWRHNKDLSGNNIMNMGIWYEAIMRWLGDMTSVFALGKTTIFHRVDAEKRRIPTPIPDHIDILGHFAQGGQMRLTVSTVIGLSPTEVDLLIFGTKGTLRVLQNKDAEIELFAGDKNASQLERIMIESEKKGKWRVEEEFVNAIRGIEEITHTDFTQGQNTWNGQMLLQFQCRQEN